MKKIQYLAYGITLFAAVSCSNQTEVGSMEKPLADSYEITDMVARGDGGSEISGGNDNASGAMDDIDAEAGTLTAGEWNDLGHWSFWQSLMQKEMFYDHQKHWKFFPTQRYAVQVMDNGSQPIMDCTVSLLDENKKVLWAAKTNNSGVAELWAQPFSEEKNLKNTILIDYNGTKKRIKYPDTYVKGVNEVVLSTTAQMPEDRTEVMFVVDATGSMEDEIGYLKKELEDVVNQVKTAEPNMELKIGSVFYRDEGDEYVTRTANLSANTNTTIDFIIQQKADGGGDYPEAVDAALIDAISNQSWSASARSRIVFLMLDAPPHDDDQSLAKLHATMKEAAKKGIKLVPIASSGIDKETEFLMRFFAMTTNGSYVFITDHSGVGNGHIEPTVGEYRVEYLNDLLARIITQSATPKAIVLE